MRMPADLGNGGCAHRRGGSSDTHTANKGQRYHASLVNLSPKRSHKAFARRSQKTLFNDFIAFDKAFARRSHKTAKA